MSFSSKLSEMASSIAAATSAEMRPGRMARGSAEPVHWNKTWSPR